MITNPTTLNACKLHRLWDARISSAAKSREAYVDAYDAFGEFAESLGWDGKAETAYAFIQSYRDAAIAAEAAAREYLAKK